MRNRRLTRWLAVAGVAILASAGRAQVVTGNASATPPGRIVNGPTNSNFGFPKPTVQPQTNSVWNPFAQAANAIQGAFRPKPAQQQYRTALMPGDPTSLKTDIPQINSQVRLHAARLAFSRNRLDEAKANYEQVLAGDPKNLESLISLARIADAKSGFDAAQPYYVQALNAYPTRAAVHNDFGMSAARNQKLELARQAFAEAVRLEPKNVRYRNNAAKALLQAGKWREALEQLVAAHPPAAAHYNYAYLLDQLGGPNDQVLFHAKQSLRFDASFAPAQQLAQLASQRQLAMQSQAPQTQLPQTQPQGRAFLPSTARTQPMPRIQQGLRAQTNPRGPQQPAVPTNPSNAPYVTVQPPGPSQAQSTPPNGYRQTRRLPPTGGVSDKMFPPQTPNGKPLYLPPSAPAWPRR